MKFIRNGAIDGVLTGLYKFHDRQGLVTGPPMMPEEDRPEFSSKELYDQGMITYGEYRQQGRILGLPFAQIEQMQGGKLK